MYQSVRLVVAPNMKRTDYAQNHQNSEECSWFDMYLFETHWTNINIFLNNYLIFQKYNTLHRIEPL